MTDPLRERIAANLRSLSDEELLAIWVANDRTSWSDTAFAAVESILTERGVALPEQSEPVTEAEDEAEEEEPEGEPVFYRPDEVFGLARTINWLASAAVVVTLLASLPSLFSLYRGGEPLFTDRPVMAFLGLLVGLFGIGLFAILQSALIYFGLKALAAVLRILMEMEFNSRAASPEAEEDGLASGAADI